jgi:predicted ArsR family transcriptional regulator
MNAMTAKEIADILKIHPKAAKTRLRRAGIQPIAYAGPTAMYDPSCVDLIREVSKGGRPRKADKPE